MAKECAYFTPDAFRQFPNDAGLDQMYVDGVSITLGRQPRKHIWMYAVERGQKFVGNHFYFETASNNNSKKTWYVKSLLWDGLSHCGVHVEAVAVFPIRWDHHQRGR